MCEHLLILTYNIKIWNIINRLKIKKIKKSEYFLS